MKHLKMLAAIGLLALAGCATDGTTTAPSQTANDAMTGVKASIAAYVDVFQPAILTYGHLVECPHPTPSGMFCHDKDVLTKMKAIDKAVVRTIVAAQAVIDGKELDTGQLTIAVQAIIAAETTISGSGILISTPAP